MTPNSEGPSTTASGRPVDYFGFVSQYGPISWFGLVSSSESVDQLIWSGLVYLHGWLCPLGSVSQS